MLSAVPTPDLAIYVMASITSSSPRADAHRAAVQCHHGLSMPHIATPRSVTALRADNSAVEARNRMRRRLGRLQIAAHDGVRWPRLAFDGL